jgi:hypothetical protein
MHHRCWNQLVLFVFICLLHSLITPSIQATPVDVDGDGLVGPQEVIDLSQSWRGPALTIGGEQIWQLNGTSVFYKNGKVGIGTNTPNHQLGISGGPGWTTHFWSGSLELDNSSAIGWRANTLGKLFGIGQTNGGLFFFRTEANLGTTGSIPEYDMTISDTGRIGIGAGAFFPNGSPPVYPLTIFTGQSAFGWVHTDGVREVGSYVDSQGGWLGTHSNNSLHFFANNSVPRMTVSPGGNVGIGTVSPDPVSKLNVVNSAADGVGVYGAANSGFASRGVWGQADQGTGVYGTSNSAQGVDSAGVLGRNTANNGTGVTGEANSGSEAYGVWGKSTGGYGVYAEGPIGIRAFSNSVPAGSAVGAAIIGIGENGSSAGSFVGNVYVVGDVIESKGLIRIDHPLDPANKYLSHSSVTSTEMMNIYNGNVVTDATGFAKVSLPDYFEALNKDFRYQLTVIGQFAQAIVSKKIQNNRFMIRTDKPNVEVSWQVTGVRQDPYAKAHPIEVEKIKPEGEHGKYLAPELYGQPKDKGINYRPEIKHMSKMNTQIK